jgi:hypothetical protein
MVLFYDPGARSMPTSRRKMVMVSFLRESDKIHADSFQKLFQTVAVEFRCDLIVPRRHIQKVIVRSQKKLLFKTKAARERSDKY